MSEATPSTPDFVAGSSATTQTLRDEWLICSASGKAGETSMLRRSACRSGGQRQRRQRGRLMRGSERQTSVANQQTAVASADEETAAQDTYGAARCRMTTSARSRGQIPRLLLGPREHPRKDDKGGDNGCNDYCVYDRHDITFRDDRIR